MKKKYIKPNIEVYNVSKEFLLTTSHEAGYSIDGNPPIEINEQEEDEEIEID